MKPRSIRRALAALSLIALAPLVACSSSAVPPAAAPSSTAAPDAAAAAVAAPAGTPSLPPQGVGAQGRAYPVVAGSSCAGHGRAEDPGRPVFRREGNTFSREEKWGCGCPTRDVFTMVYEPKTSPLKVRICVDPEADRCEALCQTSLKWNLEGPLKEAGASEVSFVE
jgi:hypothetical protein